MAPINDGRQPITITTTITTGRHRQHHCNNDTTAAAYWNQQHQQQPQPPPPCLFWDTSIMSTQHRFGFQIDDADYTTWSTGAPFLFFLLRRRVAHISSPNTSFPSFCQSRYIYGINSICQQLSIRSTRRAHERKENTQGGNSVGNGLRKRL